METLSREMIINELPGPQLNRWVHENVMVVPQLYAYFDINFNEQGEQKTTRIVIILDHLDTPLFISSTKVLNEGINANEVWQS